MNIAVCIKSVPDPEFYDKITLDPQTKRLVRDGIPAVINEADTHALEAALRLKEELGGEITVVSMGPPAARDQLMEALAMGADRAFLISDRKVGGADSLATSYTLSMLLKKTGTYDVILAGNESADGSTAHVPSQLGVWMGASHAANAVNVSWDQGIVVTRKFESGLGRYRLKTPCVIGVTGAANEVRFANVRTILAAKNKPLVIYSAADLEDLDENYLGLKGSPSQNGEVETMESSKECVMLTGTENEIAQKLSDILRQSAVRKEEA